MNILYIHGYNGSPFGSSYHHLKLYAAGHNLHSIDYNPEQPELAIQSIKQYVADNQINLIIGASLGGFLATISKPDSILSITDANNESLKWNV